MRTIRTFGLALALTGMTVIGGASVEAKGKNASGDSQEAICAYLLSVMTYQYVSPTVLAYATSLYLSYGCGTA